VARLPRPLGLSLFAGAARAALALRPRARELMLRNVRAVFPEWSEDASRRFVAASVRALGRNLFDFACIPRYSRADIERRVAVEGLEHLERARRPGVGVVCLSAHLGCWELMPLRMRVLGYPVAVVYRRLSDPGLDRWVAERRRRFGITAHERDAGVRGLLRSLREGALLGILTDQATRIDSVRVPFLGREAWSPTAPVRLAWHTGAPVVPIVTHMRRDGRHVIRIGPEIPLPPPGAEPERALRDGVARCNRAIGEMILEAKEQWVWFHDRWRE
jgi:KDO2-lipid IV(A) lauroyltransferase